MEELLAEPIIRWAGSKRKLLPWLKEYYYQSGKPNYLEPFCGSACLFFQIQPQSALLGDLNRELIEAYQMIKYSPRKLHASLVRCPRNEDYYYKLRAQDPNQMSKFDRAARFLYLNRFSFNGIYRTNRQGVYNVPRGTHTGKIPSLDAFRTVAKFYKSTQLICGDFQSVLEYANKDTFVYLDPPYVYSGRRDRGEYGANSFGVEDLKRLRNELKRLHRIGAHFVLSYVDKPEIRSIRDEWNYTEIDVKRQIGGFESRRSTISELLISNFQLGE